MNRRDFLNGTVAAGAAALMVPATPLAEAAPASATAVAADMPSFAFTRAWFERNIGTQFHIGADDQTVTAELLEVHDAGSTEQQEQFSTVFRMPADALIEGLRQVRHADGRFTLYLDRPTSLGSSQIVQVHFSLLTNT